MSWLVHSVIEGSLDVATDEGAWKKKMHGFIFVSLEIDLRIYH